MALIYCVECGEKVSDTAPACPKCGYAIRELFLGKRASAGPRQSNVRPSGQRRGSALAIACSILMPLGLIAAILGIVLMATSSYSTYVASRYQDQTNYTQLGFGILFCALGGVAELTAIILFLIWLYRTWSVVPPEYEGPSPGMAVGLLFVPIFNLYWMFRVIPGLSAALRRVLQDRDTARLRGAGFAEGVFACIAALIPYFSGGLRLLLPYAPMNYYDESYFFYGRWAALASLVLWYALSWFLWLIWLNRANSAKNRVIDSEIGGAVQVAAADRPREPGSPSHNVKSEKTKGSEVDPA